MRTRGLGTFVVVTGTDTGVGKTVTTAALATWFAEDGARVVVDKPTQTGVLPGEDGDVDEVRRLTGVLGHEGVRLRAPMAPVPAAALEPARLPTLEQHVARIRGHASRHDHVLVEGAGGLLVPLTAEGETLADLAGALGPDCAVVVVARAGLGTLNHTLLTLEALASRGLRVGGTVIGAWPASPDRIDESNAAFLSRLDVPLLGSIPDGAGELDREAFSRSAPEWFCRPATDERDVPRRPRAVPSPAR